MSRSAQLKVTELQGKIQKESKEEERRSAAKIALDRYRRPLLDSAWQLGDRLYGIRKGNFLAYLSEGSDRKESAKLTTLFRIAYYLGWREFVRTEVQLLRFADEKDTKLAAGFLNDVTWILASDELDGKRAWLWGDEQRGIGEMMTEHPSGASSIVRGHAAFSRDYDEIFAPWMERLADDLLSPAAVTSDRLRLLQWALFGLVRQLDEEGTYSVGWITHSELGIPETSPEETTTRYEAQLREHFRQQRYRQSPIIMR